MSESQNNYVVLTASGRVWSTRASPAYHSILDAIYVEYMSAGGNWDRPDILIHNGKVVVAKGLANIAWDYGKAFIQARMEAAAQINARFEACWETHPAKAAGIPVREG